MFRKLFPFVVLILGAVLLSVVAVGVGAQRPQPQTPKVVSGSGFSYQGQLKQGGGAVSAVCDMAFGIYDAASSGVQLGTAITTTVPVTAGLFTVVLNSGGEFGANAFNGDARWLDIQVRCPSGGGGFTALAPRQALTAAPYALFAAAPWMSSGSNLYYNVGKVGIGITTPVHLLHMNVITGQGEGIEIDSPIAGHAPAIYLNHTGTFGRNYRIASYGDNTNSGSFRIRDETGGSDRLIIDSQGRVGINTESAGYAPARTLEVSGKIGVFDFNRFRFGGIATESGARLINFGVNDDGSNRFGGNYTSADQGGLLRVDTRAGSDLFQFLARPAGSSSAVVQVMGISSDGNVGIGSATPARRLDVNGVVGVFTGTRSMNGGLAAEAGSDIIELGVNDGTGNRFGGSGYTAAAQGGFLRVDTRPGYPLFGFFARTAGTSGDAQPIASIAMSGTTRFEIGAGQKFSLGGSGTFEIDAPGVGAGRFLVTNDGKVGIGHNAPTSILQLQQGGGTAIGDGWIPYSSRRWKTNITTIDSALDKVQQLRGVTFDWKANGKHDVGLIAEEVGAVIPEVVKYEDNGVDAQGVDYARLVAVLIEATKEQQKQIAQQRDQIAALQREKDSQFAELKQQNAALEARMAALEQNLQTKSAPAAANHAEFNVLADLMSGSNLLAATLLGIVVTYLLRGRKIRGQE